MTDKPDLVEREKLRWEGAVDPVCEAVQKRVEPIVRKAADSLYEDIMASVQDYLRDNVNYNLNSELEVQRYTIKRQRKELDEAAAEITALTAERDQHARVALDRLQLLTQTEARLAASERQCVALRETVAACAVHIKGLAHQDFSSVTLRALDRKIDTLLNDAGKPKQSDQKREGE